MRIGSRAFWTNPLGWQDDEARGELIPLLLELTGGTSFWRATATRIPETEHWLMCWEYRWPDYDGPTLEWCTTSNDPEPPPDPDPGPPPPEYPGDFDSFGATLFPQAGTVSCWFTIPSVGPEFNGDVGPWGGWGMIFESATIGDIYMEVFLESWTLLGWTWRCNWEVVGGGSGTLTVEVAPDFAPNFFFGLGGIGDCPDANLALTCSA